MFKFPYNTYDLVDYFYRYSNGILYFRTVIGETYVLDLLSGGKLWILDSPATCEIQGWIRTIKGKLFPRDSIYVDSLFHDIVEITIHNGLYNIEIIPESTYPWSRPKEHIIINNVLEYEVWLKIPKNHGLLWINGELDKDRIYENKFKASFINYELNEKSCNDIS